MADSTIATPCYTLILIHMCMWVYVRVWIVFQWQSIIEKSVELICVITFYRFKLQKIFQAATVAYYFSFYIYHIYLSILQHICHRLICLIYDKPLIQLEHFCLSSAFDCNRIKRVLLHCSGTATDIALSIKGLKIDSLDRLDTHYAHAGRQGKQGKLIAD